VPVLLGRHPAFAGHETGYGHPEAPERLVAVHEGIAAAGLEGELVEFEPTLATRADLVRVHESNYLDALEEAASQGGALDPDTVVGPGSFEAALAAAGAGLSAIERLERGEGSSAFLALRPPGHHARRAAAMGFCLCNNVAVAAAALVARGERVLILDWDAHHGNGTQEAFWTESEVLFVSLHEYPAYPGTGALVETGAGAGAGATINVPFPSGTPGDAYRLAFDEVVVPAAERFSPSWLLVSAGFDAHRDDPLTDLGLSAGDFADLTQRAMLLAPPGRRIFFLEGGYNLTALARSAGATVAALAGVDYRPEPASRGELGECWDEGSPAAVVAAAAGLHERLVAS
jgi:acetoin utilization deacetylase AcuC-like enzyme